MYPLHRGRPAPSPRPSLIPMPPHQPAPPHQKHNSTISTIARNISAEDPASVEEKVPSRCPDLPRKPDLPRSFPEPGLPPHAGAPRRTPASPRDHASTQERAQSAVSRPPEPGVFTKRSVRPARLQGRERGAGGHGVVAPDGKQLVLAAAGWLRSPALSAASDGRGQHVHAPGSAGSCSWPRICPYGGQRGDRAGRFSGPLLSFVDLVLR